MSTVEFHQATCTYPGMSHPAVNQLDLEIGDGEFMVLVGPSGSGKSTCLRMLAGLETVESGQILVNGRDITALPPKERDMAMVFQNYALYPHMTVADNMGFALKMAGVSASERDRRVRHAAEMLGLDDLLNRKPKELSGGQQQRVAMGRAIVREPQVFLMDEPLSNLDAKLRVTTRTQIAELQQRLDITTVYVTHDQIEAMTMGHRVAVLHEGVLQQVDTPLALYDKPVNQFVASFIGSPAMNLLRGPITDGGVMIGDFVVPVARDILAQAKDESELVIGIRPEHLVIADQGISVEVELIEELGADGYLYGAPAGEHTATTFVEPQLIARVPTRTPPERGSVVKLNAAHPEDIHVFSGESGLRLSA